MVTNEAVIRVGRLLEITVDAGYSTVEEVDRLFDQVDVVLARMPWHRPRHITVVDWSLCPVMSPEAGERVVQRMTLTNGRTERTAAMVSRTSPGAVLQFLRLIREAGHPDRRLFFEAPLLESWLSERLEPNERERLRAFLAERSSARRR
ncbi:MAG TPA: hypothetical protein VKU41_15430 [Polyangiaceae bacterium]|nr:hypothetical protein [Polyangiaceae bacterium]